MNLSESKMAYIARCLEKCRRDICKVLPHEEFKIEESMISVAFAGGRMFIKVIGKEVEYYERDLQSEYEDASSIEEE